MQETKDTSGATPDHVVEAARYALLRRLAYAMRHHMVVHLQPIGMITEVMERRLQQGTPDLAQVHDSMNKINGFSRAAVQSCLDVVSWLAPEDGATVTLADGVQECLALLRSGFNFRGFTLKDEIGAAPTVVSRAGLRNVLPACLLALTDNAASPADLVMAQQATPQGAVLTLQVRRTDGAAGFAGDAPYRLLQWHEVEALARADGIGLQREADSVRLTLAAAG
jgi:C4-dicarboxylate-specific signal transduction histidine kinase